MIAHFSTVHLRDDSRIRSKMMASLNERYPGQVALLVQDGLGDEKDEAGYQVIDTGPRLGRIRRMSLGGWKNVLCYHQIPTKDCPFPRSRADP